MVESDITGAARLLAQRHARHRAAQPLLSARCEDREVTERLVTEAWKADDEPLHTYESGSAGPAAADELIAPHRWRAL